MRTFHPPNAVVIGICDEQVVCNWTDTDPVWATKPRTRRRATITGVPTLAPRNGRYITLMIYPTNSVVVRIADVKVAKCIKSDTCGVLQSCESGQTTVTSQITATATRYSGNRAIEIDSPNSVVPSVSDVQPAVGIKCDVEWLVELCSRSGTAVAREARRSVPRKGTDNASGIDFAYTFVPRVRDVHLAVPHFKAIWNVQLGVDGEPSISRGTTSPVTRNSRKNASATQLQNSVAGCHVEGTRSVIKVDGVYSIAV